MKFFIVTCLKENQDDVCKIFKQASINVFSATDIIGYKDDRPLSIMEEWFASGDEQFDSVFLFSFSANNNTLHAMELVKKYNEDNESGFPLRAFILPVEQASY